MKDIHDLLKRLEDTQEGETICLNYNEAQLILKNNELLKEQQQKKVVYDINPMTRLPVSFCPSCGEGVNMYAYGINDLKQVFCPYCGQALDWKDGERE